MDNYTRHNQTMKSLVKNSSLSDSQKEVLLLEDVVGEEVNTLAFSVLFFHYDHKEILTKAAAVVKDHYPMLFSQEGFSGGAKISNEQEIISFSSRKLFHDWSCARASEWMDYHKTCAEIIPICIDGNTEERREGFFVRLHHLYADGWGASMLLRDLSDSYNAIRQGTEPELQEVFPYEEFIDAEQAYYQSKRGLRDATFWKEFLAGYENGTLLSESRNNDFTAKRFSCDVPAGIIDGLDHNKDRTLLSVWMSAATAAYAQMLGTKQFSIGTLLLNRTNAREEHMMGNCFTTVPLPIMIAENETFSSLNDKVSDSLFAVLRRQRTTYTRLTEQAFDKKPGRPIFDVLVNYQDYTGVNTSNMEFSWYPPSKQLETLQISLIQTKESLQIHYDYRPSCISEVKVKEIHARIEAILEDVLCQTWNRPLKELSKTPHKQRALLDSWNMTAHDYPCNDTLYSLFEKQVALREDQVALYFGETRLTYREFEKQVKNLSAKLSANGVGQKQIVAVMMERSVEMMVAIYAIIRCGAAYMPIDTGAPAERVLFMLKDSKSPCILTQSKCRIEFPKGIARYDLDRMDLNEECSCPPCMAKPEMPAYVIYTSGSTGLPKGAIITHRSIVDRIHWMNRTFGMSEGDIIIQKTPYTFDVSVWELFWWSNYGGALAILPPEGHKDPEQILRDIERYQVTKMHFVPSMLSAFLAYVEASGGEDRLRSLKQVFASGEALMPAHVQKFYRLFGETELINLYGPTECTVDVSCFRCTRENRNSIPIGRPVDNTQLYILDKDLSLLPIGAVGELCVGGNLVGLGYLNRPELTEERFIENPYSEGKLYRTGDLVYWNENGEIEYVGRMDFQVKLRGQRLELGEIERCMTKIAGIHEAVAAVQKTANNEAQLVAYYTGNEKLPQKFIRQLLRKSLPEYMVPQGFMYLEEMPLTTSGKTDRKCLPEVQIEDNDVDYRAPRTKIQERLCAAFAHALEVPEKQIGLSSHFFELGGTSLRAIVLLTELFTVYPIQIKDIYTYPTPEELADYIEKSGNYSGEKENEDYSEEKDYVCLDMPVLRNPGICDGKHIFITGATGFLGIHLLHELLLKHREAKVICLVRSENKLKQCWDYMFDNERFPQERIIPMLGDISKDRLGLSDEDYQTCMINIAAVFHCAADVHHFGHWETSHSINTLGTEHVIRLCLDANVPLHHISTMSVNGYVLTSIGDRLSDEFAEENLFVGQRYRENVYVHSKYLAEKRIVDAREQGLRANIYRVGNLLWRAKDGKFQLNRKDHDFYMLTHAFLKLETVPNEFSELDVDMTAVDSCASAIQHLSMGPLGQIYHLFNPHTVSLIAYLQSLTEKQIQKVPMVEFKELLHRRSCDPQFGFLLAYSAANDRLTSDVFPTQKNDKTVKALAELGFEWEVPTNQYARFVL